MQKAGACVRLCCAGGECTRPRPASPPACRPPRAVDNRNEIASKTKTPNHFKCNANHPLMMQVNKAIDLLMDKLDNDDFAAAVFTKETALHSKQREASGEDEKREIVAKGIVHYFDTDHSNDIDALEFHEGMRMMSHDMDRFARGVRVRDSQATRGVRDGRVAPVAG